MRAIAITAGCAAMLAALAGCGGSSAPSGPPTIAQAAKQAGCTKVNGIVTGEEFYTHQTATCALPGNPDADLATFVSPGEQRAWETFAGQYGVILKHGDGWSVGGM